MAHVHGRMSLYMCSCVLPSLEENRNSYLSDCSILVQILFYFFDQQRKFQHQKFILLFNNLHLHVFAASNCARKEMHQVSAYLINHFVLKPINFYSPTVPFLLSFDCTLMCISLSSLFCSSKCITNGWFDRYLFAFSLI